ncbi:MAG TPA: phosphate ABC transporter substrate-binding protein [Armatimonadota bacterium]|jgi:phosphate transport system substrate-binding protein
MKQFSQCGLLLAAAAISVAGCNKPATSQNGGSPGSPATPAAGITVKGSDTMVNLGQAWAEEFQKTPGNPAVSVQGGGSGTGVAALLNKSTSIAEMSRAMKPEEISSAKAKGITAVETIVARDGLSVIVNKDNPVEKLSIPQLSQIFQGKYSNWKQVGGPDLPITLQSRDKSSGSFDFFLNHVLRHGNDKGPEQYAAFARLQPSSQSIVKEVENNKGAIGYVGLGYVKGAKIKDLAVSKTDAGPFVKPTVDTVLGGTYPIARPLYFYTDGQPAGDVKKYVDFVLSPAGQAVVTSMDFVPVKK